jgi:hypothetical protein
MIIKLGGLDIRDNSAWTTLKTILIYNNSFFYFAEAITSTFRTSRATSVNMLRDL